MVKRPLRVRTLSHRTTCGILATESSSLRKKIHRGELPKCNHINSLHRCSRTQLWVVLISPWHPPSAPITFHQACDACARHALVEVHLPGDAFFGHAQARGLFGGHSLRHGETSVARNQLEEHADGRDRSSGQTTWYGQLCVATRHRGQFPTSANSASRLLTKNISQAQRNRPGQLHPC